MYAPHPFDPRRRADETDQPNAFRSALLEPVDRRNSSVSGGENRDHHNHKPFREIGRRLEKIFDCDKSFRFAVKPDMRNPCGWDEIKDALRHRNAGAKYRGNDKLLSGDLRGGHACEGSFDLDTRQRQVTRDLITQQHADFLEQLAKRLGRAILVADHRELMLNQRMIDDGDAFHENLPAFIQLSKHAAVARDANWRRAVRPQLLSERSACRPGSALKKHCEREGPGVDIEPMTYHFGQQIKQRDRERPPFHHQDGRYIVFVRSLQWVAQSQDAGVDKKPSIAILGETGKTIDVRHFQSRPLQRLYQRVCEPLCEFMQRHKTVGRISCCHQRVTPAVAERNTVKRQSRRPDAREMSEQLRKN